MTYEAKGWRIFLGLALLAAPGFADDSLLGGGKVIYGADDRIDVYQETDPDRLRWAAATCALVNSSLVANDGDGTYALLTGSYRISGYPPCANEPFATQPTLARCTAFLVGPDILVTAGHCMDSSRLATTSFVFGFDMQGVAYPVTVLDASQVYTCVEIIGRRLDSSSYDYAVLRLDRPVTAPGAVPLPIRREGVVPVGASVGVIGHPSGLPKKIAFGAQTAVRANDHPAFFTSNLDTYGGNSGSPVFNAVTGVVEGILVRGERDFNISGGCFVSNQLPDNNPKSEEVSKSTTFAQLVPELPEGEDEGEPLKRHTADTNRNGRISLSEVLRVVQFHNSSGYRCLQGTEDDRAPGKGSEDCENHDSDYNPANFEIEMSELLRLIQMYNSAGYVACDGGEDGYCL